MFMTACHQTESSTKRIFKYNQADNINSLDPAFAKAQNNIWAVNQIFDGLVYFEDDQIKPRLAKSWSVSEDGKLFTFDLDNSYKFHQNDCFNSESERMLSAHDVVFSFERILSNTINSPGSWIFAGIVDEDKPFVALNDTTFQLKLKDAFIPILGILSMQYCSIVSKKAVDYYGRSFRKNPVGTGPFQFKRWKENHALYLQSNLEYPNIKHNLDGIKVSFVPDKKIAFYEFKNGKIDFISGVESSFANELLSKDGKLLDELSGQMNFYTNPYLNLEYIGINQNLSKLNILGNLSFRKALHIAINREELLQLFKNNIGEPAINGVIPKGLKGHNEDFSYGSYRPDLAKSIIDSLGMIYNLDTTLTIYTNQEYVDVITYVSKSWENIGLKVNVEIAESAILRQQMRNGQVNLFRASWIADYLEEQSYLCLFYGKNPAPPNYSQFKSSGYDIIYERAISESDNNWRYQMYRTLDSIVINNLPIIPLYYDETALFVSKRIRSGFTSNPLNVLDLRKIQMD